MASGRDWLLRLLTFVALAWALILGKDLHTEVQARQLRDPDQYPQYSDLWTAAYSFAAMFCAQLLFRWIFMPVAKAMIPKKMKWHEAVWGLKKTRCCDYVFKCSYYSAMTVWGFSLLRKEPWMPPVLGGTGSTLACWTDGFPFQPVSAEIRRFYLTAIGYHLAEVLMLVWETKTPDFSQMLLHHTLSCALMGFSYILNYVRIGSLILFLHGVTDVPLYFSKAVIDTPFTTLIALSYFALIASYLALRIVVYPAYMMRSSWVEAVTEVSHDRLLGWGFLNFAMGCLFLLHMYWFGLILKIVLNFKRTGEARDMQANLSRKDMQEELSRSHKKKAKAS